MQDFIIKELVTQNIESELEKIGFDKAYRVKATNKYRYKTLKIFNLSLPQANILKQTALSLGADCGVHRDILTANIQNTDVILGGSFSQLMKICEKLKQQPFSMKILAENILAQIDKHSRNTKLVGILNITPDSFSDGGLYFSKENVIEHFHQLIDDGADMIDIGAESTRPNAQNISAQEQIERLSLLFDNIKKFDVPISVDTRDSEVAKYVLDKGANFINDVSGLNSDPKILDIVDQYNAGIIIQHSTKNTADRSNYNDVVEEVFLSLLKKIKLAENKGIKNIIIDPGIGFGKNKNDNFEILERIEEFYSLDTPIMVGVSRKSFLGVKENNNLLKDSLTLAISYPLIQKNIDYLRVHNVKLHRQLLNLAI